MLYYIKFDIHVYIIVFCNYQIVPIEMLATNLEIVIAVFCFLLKKKISARCQFLLPKIVFVFHKGRLCNLISSTSNRISLPA